MPNGRPAAWSEIFRWIAHFLSMEELTAVAQLVEAGKNDEGLAFLDQKRAQAREANAAFRAQHRDLDSLSRPPLRFELSRDEASEVEWYEDELRKLESRERAFRGAAENARRILFPLADDADD